MRVWQTTLEGFPIIRTDVNVFARRLAREIFARHIMDFRRDWKVPTTEGGAHQL